MGACVRGLWSMVHMGVRVGANTAAPRITNSEGTPDAKSTQTRVHAHPHARARPRAHTRARACAHAHADARVHTDQGCWVMVLVDLETPGSKCA